MRKGTASLMDPTGRLGTMRQLWERYCSLTLQIDKLREQRNSIRKQLLQHDATFFDTKHSLVGTSFPFFVELRDRRKSRPGIAFRDALILQAKTKLKDTSLILDLYKVPIPRQWTASFPKVKTWHDAYLHQGCRPRLEKLVSDVRSRSRLP